MSLDILVGKDGRRDLRIFGDSNRLRSALRGNGNVFSAVVPATRQLERTLRGQKRRRIVIPVKDPGIV